MSSSMECIGTNSMLRGHVSVCIFSQRTSGEPQKLVADRTFWLGQVLSMGTDFPISRRAWHAMSRGFQLLVGSVPWERNISLFGEVSMRYLTKRHIYTMGDDCGYS